jgi:hypothetical protein
MSLPVNAPEKDGEGWRKNIWHAMVRFLTKASLN